MQQDRKKAISVLFLILLVSAGAAILVPNLRFDYQYERFFPSDDPDVAFYWEFRSTDTTGKGYTVVAIGNDDGVFEQDFLLQLENAKAAVEAIPQTDHVTTLSDLFNPIVGPMGEVYKVPFIPKKEGIFYPDTTQLLDNPMLRNIWISSDTTGVAMQVVSKNFIDEADKRAFLAQLEDTLASVGFDEFHVLGPIKGSTARITTMQREFVLFAVISLVLLIILLWFTFSAWGIWLPMIVVALSALWLLGLMAVADINISILNMLIPTILFVVGMSDVVHILEKYLEELRLGRAKREALLKSIREIGKATLLTSLTTSIGFLALMTSAIEPVREFGWITAAGVFIAFILAITLLPSVLILLPAPRKMKAKERNGALLGRLYMLVLRKRKPALALSLVVAGIAGWGMSQLEINNFLLEDWDEDAEVHQHYAYFEEHFSGFRDFEMALEVADDSLKLTDRNVLLEIEQLENYLQETYGVTITVSPVTLIKGANKALSNGAMNEWKLPETESGFRKTRKQMKRFIRPADLATLLDKDHKKGRLAGKLPDLGAIVFEQKNDSLEHFIATEIDSSLVKVRQTGIAFLIDKNNAYLSSSLTLGLVLAFGIVALLMGLLYRSFMMVFIALIANALPLLLIAGFMGFASIDLKISTSLVFTIAFGIAVDDTIHFLSRLRLELRKGTSLLFAMRRTYISTGKAILITTMMLCAGFLTLTASSINSTFYIGLLTSLALFFAVVVDLILLPLLILFLYRPGKAKFKV